VPYVTSPIGFIVTDERVVTICRHEHELLLHLPHEHQTDLSTAKPTRFVLHLLWSAANSYLRHLNEINKVVEKLEEGVEHSLQNREVLALLRYQKSLLHFTTALRANETMLERLKRSEFLKLGRNDADLLDDVFTETHQAIGMSEIASDILSQMMDAFATIISNNLNVVMKFLAAITVILIVPTIIGTFYGMNLHLPLEDRRLPF
jgi:magnesium transporter